MEPLSVIAKIGIPVLRKVGLAFSTRRQLELTVHQAHFESDPTKTQFYFVTATNFSKGRDLEITHVWFETKPREHILNPERKLPKRLKPDESWQTWVLVRSVPISPEADPFVLARARLSTGKIIKSKLNEDVPERGSVPGGSTQTELQTLLVLVSQEPTKKNIERVILASDSKNDWDGRSTDDKSITVFKQDVNLRLEMSHGPEGIQCEDFKADWANKFPHAKAKGFWCNLYYGASLIERFVLVGVDGSMALLPPPKELDRNNVRSVVLPLDYKIAQIQDVTETLFEYMTWSGLSVLSSRPPLS